MRWIDADALKEAVNTKKVVGRFNIIQLIDDAPTVDISKEVWNKSNELLNKRLAYLVRPQGEWKLDSLGAYCSECGTHPDYSSNFCPNCGADMRGEGDNEHNR